MLLIPSFFVFIVDLRSTRLLICISTSVPQLLQISSNSELRAEMELTGVELRRRGYLFTLFAIDSPPFPLSFSRASWPVPRNPACSERRLRRPPATAVNCLPSIHLRGPSKLLPSPPCPS